ncbi:hypothetical protein [Shewanella sp. 10N.286.48.A6]|uniref:hypothetical protein n=1 Tax=Shewanella sp. 10N.286.48.A6 TaxID=1880833 RepID=UPI000C842CAD|nr:hypothetical protein [Shewanella sp. 10N.286.48.A6]PMH98991.1 hypothetical protein BCU55_02010 [Shewanella sp. 10N.286.48.A6]
MTILKGIFPLIFVFIISQIAPLFMTIDSPQANEFEQLVSKPASENKQPNQASLSMKSLPMNVVLDHQGQAIELPATQSALDYSADEMLLEPSSTQQAVKRDTSTANNKKATSKNKPLRLAKKTANDPSCRWLGNRIKQLRVQLKRHYSDHVETELSHRQNEWDCLQCSTSGPSQEQYSQCQYRR